MNLPFEDLDLKQVLALTVNVYIKRSLFMNLEFFTVREERRVYKNKFNNAALNMHMN